MQDRTRPTLLILLLAVVSCAAGTVVIGHGERPVRPRAMGPTPLISPTNSQVEEGSVITIRTSEGDAIWYSVDADGSDERLLDDHVSLLAQPDRRGTTSALCTPTGMQWRHPLFGLPCAMVVRAMEVEGSKALGPSVMQTYLFTDHGVLPVVSISIDPDALYDPDDGIAVVGNGIMHMGQDVLTSYQSDARWWKYPGNYHGRGREWERPARMQLIDPDGRQMFQCDARIRINGQMTRGFPQHAFRLLFDEPLDVAPFRDGDGVGSEALVLRAAGNDQVKAMMRDAYQHGLCAGLPFETSKALTTVVYINGAYQGVHHLRQRMDEKELARRYSVKVSNVALIEDNNVLAHGDVREVDDFASVVRATEQWDGTGPSWPDSLAKRIDVDGFLTYMAAQMILGNMDWPAQNVKYWRYAGPSRSTPPMDGRWYFIMGDSDLGFGANVPVAQDMFGQVIRAKVPIARLFRAMMRSTAFKERFIGIAQGLLRDQLSSTRCLAHLEEIVARMDPEMDRHTARWRKPLDKRTWLGEVAIMRHFAQERAGQVRQQLEQFSTE